MHNIEKNLLVGVCGGSYCACFYDVHDTWVIEGVAVRYFAQSLADCKAICCSDEGLDEDRVKGYVISSHDMLFDPAQIHNCPNRKTS